MRASDPARPIPVGVVSHRDLITLTKAKLSLLVVVTTGAAFVSGWMVPPAGGGFAWARFFHTIFGTTLAAFGAAVFNQLLEIEADRRMGRTADRPLPSGRIPVVAAFGIGWLLSALGIVHLGVMVNTPAAFLAGLTIAIYIFAYTPLKTRSSWNTIVGAVSGALPPVIGWVAADRPFDAGAWWWFALLFFWQMPHFYAINWIHREEYRKAGFVMLANEDDSGATTALWSVLFAAPLMLLAAWAPFIPVAKPWFTPIGLISGGYVTWLAVRFHVDRKVGSARALFFGTLLYLPVTLLAVMLAKP